MHRQLYKFNKQIFVNFLYVTWKFLFYVNSGFKMYNVVHP